MRGASMSMREVMAAALTAGGTGPVPALPAGDVPGGAVPGRGLRTVARPRPGPGGGGRGGPGSGWPRYAARSPLSAVSPPGTWPPGRCWPPPGWRPSAKLSGFTGASGPRPRLRPARPRPTWPDGAGGRRDMARDHRAAGLVRGAEALDGFLVRPGCLAGAAWLARRCRRGMAGVRGRQDRRGRGLVRHGGLGPPRRGPRRSPPRSRPPRTCCSISPGPRTASPS